MNLITKRIFFFFLSLVFTISPIVGMSCTSEEFMVYGDSCVFVEFYKLTGGETDWTVKLDFEKPFDEWKEVNVIEGRIFHLYLDENNLVGPLPEILGDLDSLRSISLQDNKLTGSIPSSFANLKKLGALKLGGNQLSGNIPEFIGSFSSMESLFLDRNQFDGVIPDTLGNLTQMIDLRLSSNQLSGQIPPSLGNLKKLIGLHLSNNNLSGTIPPQLGELKELLALSLQYNDSLSGPIPSTIGNLSKLEYLILENCNLSDPLPSTLGNLDSLKVLNLRNNKDALGNGGFTGIIPESFGNLVKLEMLWLQGNKLSGMIPDTLGNLGKLKELKLDDNELTGTIPFSLGNLVLLESLALGYNQLEGELPSTLGNLEFLKALGVHSNENLTGNIPFQISNLKKLEYFGANSCNLIGTIPAGFGLLENLTELYLHDNNLSGCLAPELANLCINGVEVYINGNPELEMGGNFEAFCQANIGICLSENNDLVWSGDFNNDGIVNHVDLLYWGWSFGQEGAERLDTSTNWTGFVVDDWSHEAFGVNGKFQDGNGDGIVDYKDYDVLVENYSLTRDTANAVVEYPSDAFNIIARKSEESTNERTIYNIYIDTDNTIDSIFMHGAAFTFDLNAATLRYNIDLNDVLVSFDNSCIEPDTSIIFKDTQKNILEISVTRIDQMVVACNKSIADIIIEDDLPTKEVLDIDGFILGGYKYVESNLGAKKRIESLELQLAPNPTTGNIYLKKDFIQPSDIQLTLFDISGNELLSRKIRNVQSFEEHMNLTQYKTGMYILQVETENKITRHKIVLVR